MKVLGHIRYSLSINGTLYGSTIQGGGRSNSGTIYSISTTGVEKVLYAFGWSDGSSPLAGLTHVNATVPFYGTTVWGGAYGRGVVYSATTNGVEKVIHSLAINSGEQPFAGVIDVNGTLYGTTTFGGTQTPHRGVLFSLGTNGTYAVLHTFTGHPDGAKPEARLIRLNGTLYGTTKCRRLRKPERLRNRLHAVPVTRGGEQTRDPKYAGCP